MSRRRNPPRRCGCGRVLTNKQTVHCSHGCYSRFRQNAADPTRRQIVNATARIREGWTDEIFYERAGVEAPAWFPACVIADAIGIEPVDLSTLPEVDVAA